MSAAAQQLFEWGKGGGGGAKEESVNKIWGGACLGITLFTRFFFHMFSDVTIGSQNSPSINRNIPLMLTFSFCK